MSKIALSLHHNNSNKYKFKEMEFKKITLLTSSNPKTAKSDKLISDKNGKAYKTYMLYMAPYKQNDFGFNVCPKATKTCILGCLANSGHGGKFDVVKNARKTKAANFKINKDLFMRQLFAEITLLTIKHSNDNLCIRLNGTSDLIYENIKVLGFNNIFEAFPNVQFYDYTKVFDRLTKKIPSNYHLTFSRNEENENEAKKALDLGFNVAVVFDSPNLPKMYLGKKVINGDLHDLRFIDEPNTIVGLTYKKMTFKGAKEVNEQMLNNGFVVSTK